MSNNDTPPNTATRGPLQKGLIKVIRVELPDDLYTRIHPSICHDNSLSLKARGLLLTLIGIAQTDARFEIDQEELIRSLPDGIRSFRAAKNELKRAGYLRCTRVQRGFQRTITWLWQVFDTPQAFREHQQLGLFEKLDQSMAPGSKPETPYTPLFDAVESTAQQHEPCIQNAPVAEPSVQNALLAHAPVADASAARAHHNGSYGAAHHGAGQSGRADGQDHVIDDLESAAKPAPSPSRPRRGRLRKQNAVGGPCLRNIDDPGILADTGRLVALWAEERRRGAVGDDAGCSLRQFVAAAVRAIHVVRKEHGNPIAVFAQLVNKRATHNDKPWASITEEQWGEADRRLRDHHESQGPARQVARINAIARNMDRNPFDIARHQGVVKTLAEWEKLQREAEAAQQPQPVTR